MRETIDFGSQWRFRREEEVSVACKQFGLRDVENPEPRQWQKAGWHSISMPDNPHPLEWRTVDLPHDFLLEGSFAPEAPQKTGSLPYGRAWYVKDFELPRERGRQRVVIEFDGIFRNSQVYVNGHFIGRRLSGYASAAYDISEVCSFTEANRIAVFADATETEQWSYQGGGIYRAVRLVLTDDVHVVYRGLHIKATNDGAVELAVTVENAAYESAECMVEAEVLDTRARGAGELIVGAQDTAVATLKLTVDQPRLWSIDEPSLYTLRVTLMVKDQAVDSVEERFGFREIQFNAANGFHLNGENMKIKGLCCHQDAAGVGVAVPPELWEWRVLRLKSIGCNAIRTSHNMPDPALLDACDKHGMLVMEEMRLPGCAAELQRDLADTITRDRNHPCVILWSLANEEPMMTKPVGARIFKKLHHLARRLDPTRPTTCAVVGDWFEAARLFEEHGFRLDVFGMNYRNGPDGSKYDRFHETYPDWPFLATESWGGFTSRGLYESDFTAISRDWHDHPNAWESEEYRNFVSAYGTTFAGYGCHLEECWRDCANRPALAVTFIWTGFDYRGETAPHTWPAVISYFGMLDLCGFYKELAHYLKCWWRPNDTHTSLMPHWNWQGREGEPIRVRCYSNAAEIALTLNGRQISRDRMPVNGRLEWQVPYEAGVLEAIGYDDQGREVPRARRVTAAAPAKLAIESEVIGNLAVVNIEVQDKHGNGCPLATNQVEFAVSEGAEILGVGNGNPVSHEPVKFTNKRRAHFGLCQVIVRKTGNAATVTASSHLLEGAEVVL